MCVICYTGATDDPARTPDESAPDLAQRMMRCSYLRGENGQPCKGRLNPVPSNVKAAFFQSRPTEEYDNYYDGCWGWD